MKGPSRSPPRYSINIIAILHDITTQIFHDEPPLSRLNSAFVLLPLEAAEREAQNVLFSPGLRLQLQRNLEITRLLNVVCALLLNTNPPMQVSGSNSLGSRLVDIIICLLTLLCNDN